VDLYGTGGIKLDSVRGGGKKKRKTRQSEIGVVVRPTGYLEVGSIEVGYT